MGKLQTKGEWPDKQQEKHDNYLEAGFKLIRTHTSKKGIVKRLYQKIGKRKKTP